MSEWRKAIPERRDRLQSRLLVWVVGTALVLLAWGRTAFLFRFPFAPRQYHAYPALIRIAWMAWFVSLTFAALVWALRSATPMAAFHGSLVCILVIFGTVRTDLNVFHSGLSPLLALFALTFFATRAGRGVKRRAGLAESRRGRNAAQVVANLGMTALVPSGLFSGILDRIGPQGGVVGFSMYSLAPLLLAALCEATADTVSSEIGQAFGGRPILLTTLRRVEPGTDGAVTLLGTGAGMLAAAIVAAVGMASMALSFRSTMIAFSGGVAGLFFDSLLGATVERKGWLGNDLVNFASTLFAVLVALVLLLRLPG